jgi:hypothetical protein
MVVSLLNITHSSNNSKLFCLLYFLSMLHLTFTSFQSGFDNILFKTYTALTQKIYSISCHHMYKTRKYYIISKYPFVNLASIDEHYAYNASEIERKIRETFLWLGDLVSMTCLLYGREYSALKSRRLLAASKLSLIT